MTPSGAATEEACLLVVRCSLERGAPQTLRIRTAYYPRVGGPLGPVSAFGRVDEAVAAIQTVLRLFVDQTGGDGRVQEARE